MTKNIPYRPISVKRFDGEYNAWDQVRGYKTVPRLLPHILRHVWSPIIFKDGYRLGANFVESHWCVLDFDNSLHIDQAKKDFLDYQYVIALTKSHTEHYHAFRVIIPWQRAITDFDEYKHNMARLIKIAGSDASCKDLARFYWPSLGGIYAHNLDGEAMEVESAPDAIIRTKQRTTIANPNTMPLWLKSELTKVFEHGERRPKLFKLGCQLRRAGYDRETAVEIGAATVKLRKPLDEAEIKRHIERGWEAENSQTT